MKHFFAVAAISTCLALVGCKIEITTPEGGKVISKSGNYQCPPSETCTIDIYDIFFNEEFKGVANDGFEFLTWRKGGYYLCGGKSDRCPIDSSLAQLHPNFMDLLESDGKFYLEPIFREHGRDRLPLSGPKYNSEDVYAYEATWPRTQIFDPYLWEKACRIPYLSKSEFMIIKEIEWWGYYDLGDLPENTDKLVFDIIFYAAKTFFSQDQKIVTKRRFSVNVAPYRWHWSQPATTISSYRPSRHVGRTLYRYNKNFGKPVYVPRGDVFFSIVQIDQDSGSSDANFIWHAASSTIGRMYYLTDYGGWLAGSVTGCQLEWGGYYSGWSD
jgi:hypothetical protein